MILMILYENIVDGDTTRKHQHVFLGLSENMFPPSLTVLDNSWLVVWNIFYFSIYWE